MFEPFPPRVSCIYQIRCIPTGRIYIGSAADLRDRWGSHRRNLRRGDHPNGHLQQAWKRYGERNFELSILELVHRSDLLTAEQAWLDGSGCTDKRRGFNFRAFATSAGRGISMKREGFVDPNGISVIVDNLGRFCRKHGLDYRSMHRLAMGRSKLKSYKGWTHKNSIRKRPYIKSHTGFIDASGKPIGTIVNLAAFCREHKLVQSHLIKVAKGELCSHLGWTHEHGRKATPPKMYKGFVAPTGERVEITNLSSFCRRNGLCLVHMHEIKSGKRKSHKGWTWQAPR